MKERKSHGIQLLLRCVVRDPDGKVITDTGTKPARSFVIQILEFIYFVGRGTGNGLGTATAIDGTEQTIYTLANPITQTFNIDAPVNDDDYGIVVGTGDTAETNTDFTLETQLTEGVGLGNITHGAQVIGTAAVVGANVDLVINRAFTNNTGAVITVNESGVYTNVAAIAANTHLIIRDVFGTSVDIPDRCSLSIIYTVRTTV